MVQRRQVRVTGTVQGVGFRPFVYREAVGLGLGGYVRNDSAGVLIEVQGLPEAITELCRRLVEEPPPLARIVGLTSSTVTPLESEPGFVIVDSAEDGPPDVPVSVDSATCPECLSDVERAGDRRFGYPFTNCTNCGPRYTIVVSVPYDRPSTTMAGFTMCPACQSEYDDPADRRFHAQPNACPECGPTLQFLHPDRSGRVAGPAAFEAAVAVLRGGGILAVKGIGGFHLAVDAADELAVSELRRRKARDDKPFAVMVRDAVMARRLVGLDAMAETLLHSPRRPIVLAPRAPGATTLAAKVAPGLSELGVMLPYTPLHHLLMRRLGRPLVMTSGNLSDDPIAYTDDDAQQRLGSLVDGFLTHDRPIHIRCDDSVVRVRDGRQQMLRRSRGFAPEPLALPFHARRPVLAVGAELKNTVSVAKGDMVFASHHVGDLEHLAAYRSFQQALEHLCRLFGVVPEVVAHDLHPEYLSSKFALDLDLPALAVQHHHAHVAACLVDHHRDERVLGVAFDGLGFGTDGSLWGGEFLLADFDGFQRAGTLRQVAMPGGAAAIREPWRMAVAWVRHSSGTDAAHEVGAGFDERAGAVVQLAEGSSAPRTSSMGRLFDALAALIGVGARVSYEGQAAIELESLARSATGRHGPTYSCEQLWAGGMLVIDPAPMVRAVVRDRLGRVDQADMARGVHVALAEATSTAAVALAGAHGIGTVALTGGVFQNSLLSELVEERLAGHGLEVLVHRDVPPNDGGISVGQAAIAAHRSR